MGLLLREVAEAVQQGPQVRQLAVSVLKNLLIKHAMDDRYTLKVKRDNEAKNRRALFIIKNYYNMTKTDFSAFI